MPSHKNSHRLGAEVHGPEAPFRTLDPPECCKGWSGKSAIHFDPPSADTVHQPGTGSAKNRCYLGARNAEDILHALLYILAVLTSLDNQENFLEAEMDFSWQHALCRNEWGRWGIGPFPDEPQGVVGLVNP